MIITCPSCATRYKVPDGAFGAEGRNVRCKACSFEWLAVAEEPIEAPAGEDEAADATADPDVATEQGDGEPDELKGETVPDEPLRVPVEPRAPADIESAARRRIRRDERAQRSRRRRRIVMVAAATVAMLMVPPYVLRHAIVDLYPAAEPFYEMVGVPINKFGLDFANVRVAREFENGLPVLTVAGDVVNVSSGDVVVPRVRLGLRDSRNQEIYHWTVSVSDDPLPPEGRARFATRLAAPPNEAADVQVRFNGRPGKERSQASLSGS